MNPFFSKHKIQIPLVNIAEATQAVKRNSTESLSCHNHDPCQITQDLYLGRQPLLFTNIRATSQMQARW